MNIKFYISFALIALGVNMKGQAQVAFNKWLSGPIGSSPKSASLGIGNAVVDEVQRSTGTVNINIPLYEVKAHDISVPISLSYSALGLKMGQEAGPAGMGWELNAGGKLNKQINGLDDETAPSSINNSINPINLDPNNSLSDRTTLLQVVDGQVDYAYDIYSYTVPGGSGKVTKNGLSFPYNPTVKFDHYNNRITTGNGLVHSFEMGDELLVSKRKFYKRKNDGSYNMEEIPGSVQWVQDIKEQKTDYNLSMITSQRSRDTVKFEYEVLQSAGPMSGIADRSRTTTTEQLGLTRDMIRMSNGQWTDKYGSYYFLSEPIIGQTKIDVVKHRRIKRILYPTGKVEFLYRSASLLGRDVLTAVQIYQKIQGTYKRLKQYKFNYDSDENYGHYLKDLIVLNADSVNAGVWKFKYNGYTGTGIVGKRLIAPNVQSNAQDRWGFYNGKTGNKTLIEKPDNMLNLADRPHYRSCLPNFPGTSSSYFVASRPEAFKYYNPTATAPVNVDFANRDSEFFNTVSGTISRVTTPTGEFIDYEYEPHKFYINGAGGLYSKVQEGGGIRIKAITRTDGMLYGLKTLSKKTFTYGMGTYTSQSSTEVGHGIVNVPGVIAGITQYYEHNSTVKAWIENLVIYSHPLNDLTLYNGSYAHYPSVVESTYHNGAINHQTVYYDASSIETSKWTNLQVGNQQNQLFPDRDDNFGIKRHSYAGQPTHIIEYNGIRSGNTIAKVTTNTYSNFLPTNPPKLYSYYGGVNGTKISTSSTFMMICVADGPDGMAYNCTTLATVANMDPLGYLFLGPEVPDSWYQGKYFGSTLEYSTYSNIYKLTNTNTVTYNTIYVDPFNTSQSIIYGNVNHMQPTRVISSTSEGGTKLKLVTYPQDLLTYSVSGADKLRSKNIITEPIAEFEMTEQSDPRIMYGTKKTFKEINGLVLQDSTYYLNTKGKLLWLSNYNTQSDSLYEPYQSIDQYDEMGNPIFGARVKDSKTAVVWGYNQQYPIAEVMNVSSMSEVAFANFESDNRAAWKGYWSYNGLPELDPTSPSVDKIYKLENGSITKTMPAAGKKYLLGYWYKYGSAVTVTGGTVEPEIIKNKLGNWVFAERIITSGTSLSISGTGSIDEIRLCPLEAMMKTYTYSPGIGITRVQDEKGGFSLYEYDAEQRLKIIRDQHGNVVKAYDYHIGDGYKQTSGSESN